MDRFYRYDEIKGVSSRNMPWFNRLMKGFRRGELTILTGKTGVGKTTFLAHYSLGFLMNQIPTLWGSFEIKNEILSTTLLQ
jgi:twinkle protein